MDRAGLAGKNPFVLVFSVGFFPPVFGRTKSGKKSELDNSRYFAFPYFSFDSPKEK